MSATLLSRTAYRGLRAPAMHSLQPMEKRQIRQFPQVSETVALS